MTQPLSDEQLAALLDELEELAEADEHAALERIVALPSGIADEPEVRLLGSTLRFSVEGPAAARSQLERLVEDEPDFADAHYTLAHVSEQLGDTEACTQHLLEVLAIDADADNSAGFDARAHEAVVLEAAERTLASLPSPFKERLAEVPILIEDRPRRELVRSGFDPRALGLFEGPNDADRRGGEFSEQPTRIVLYSSNLLAAAETPEELADEVEITVLHEVGHFFGLDEDDMERLGLD
jgi:predicted Zn-dependent protease with MMP-like domain